MISMMWLVLFVALTGAELGQGFPLKTTPQAYPHVSAEAPLEAWGSSGLYAAVPALALVLAAVGLLFGCTWCYRLKDCKPNEGAENQLFTANATHLNDGRRPPDSGFSEPVNNNISEDNNNGPISLREMQNIANNNAAAYIVSENEERNRVSRESVVEFEPLPSGIRPIADPLERCADWFGVDDFPRSRLQYLREIARGWFGRVVEGEIETEDGTTAVAVKILNQNASLEDKARFLEEASLYRDVTHDNVLAFVTKCLQEDPWILMFELCSMDLQQFLVSNRPKMAILNDSGVPLQLLCDVTSALTFLHSRGHLYGNVNSTNVLVRDATGASPRAVLGTYASTSRHEFLPPENRRHPPLHTASSEVWSVGTLIWEVCTWGSPVPEHQPPPPDLPCPYRNHLYQVMQLCWNPNAELRPNSSQVHALLNHLHTTHTHSTPQDDGYGSSDFEDRWQRLKPNTIPKVDEHIALVHAPSTSMASHFTGSEEFDNAPTTQDTLSVDMDTAVSRSSSIMSDKDPLSVQIKSESLTNLHGSLEDVRNIYLTHNETPALECHQGNISFEDCKEREQDKSDSSVDPWVKDLIAGSQDDVSYYKDVSDVIKNLDNILNSEKTSSSESSHQASPSRDNLSLDCKKEYPVQSSMVKSPGITNFKNILELSFDDKEDQICDDDEVDRDTIGTLSHSFERHSDTISQQTLENLTPDTPLKDLDINGKIEEENQVIKVTDNNQSFEVNETNFASEIANQTDVNGITNTAIESPKENTELPKQKIANSESKLPKLKDLSVISLCSISDKQLNISEDCVTSCDSKINTRTQVETKSIENTVQIDEVIENKPILSVNNIEIRNEFETPENVLCVIQDQELNKVALLEEEPQVYAKSNNIEKSVVDVSCKTITDIAVNFIENEVIHPAVEIAFQMAKDKSQKEFNEQPPIKLEDESIILNMNNGTVFNKCPIQATLSLIEEERKQSYDSSNGSSLNVERVHEMKIEKSSSLDNQDAPPMPNKPESVQTIYDKDTIQTATDKADTVITPDIVQVTDLPHEVQNQEGNETILYEDSLEPFGNGTSIYLQENTRSEIVKTEHSNDSTAYMDLINYTNSEAVSSKILQDNVKDAMQFCLESTNGNSYRNESTEYLDLPSVIANTTDFLQTERVASHSDNKIYASTPITSECSAETTIEASAKTDVDLSETKIPDERTEHKFIQELLSPFDSPTKSHPTDTYDENSSVVLGPFENCTMESKGFKMEVDLPKEELLAFSSNFSEMNLETPSPLRDGNFLNEVPDIAADDLQDDFTISEVKKDSDNTDESGQSATTKHVSPSTPPNSPGIYLASTSHNKYLVDIDFEVPEPIYPPIESIQSDSGLSSLQKDIDYNLIELQISAKLAMAENENNMNIEYSGPLTVEGVVSEDEVILREIDAVPETFLAGNGGSLDDHSEPITLDEECVKALRNELELKLPLAQVCGIEPTGLEIEEQTDTNAENSDEASWLPIPAPELVVSYAACALSPIAEETRNQLHDYENDQWNTSTRTESSESYPEPCYESTAEVTDLPSHSHSQHDTYTVRSQHCNNTYTIQKDITTTSTSKELTMSADSLNGSPYKKPRSPPPIDDRTYNKDDEKVTESCERISQVSPFLMSPTTDTSGPDSINVTGVSTLSKTTLPTDAKHSKPTECLSKATSIDSWCSNDTLYNVEENFDDLVDGDVDVQFENERQLAKSASTATLTHEEDKEISHCSTCIVHDSKSEQACDTFTPDSIAEHHNNTYTKIKTEVTVPSVPTTERNDSKNTTIDLAYETLPSYSNCTTEVLSSINDPWKICQPELVRRSPIDEITFTPPRLVEEKEETLEDSPKIITDSINRMDSVEITCLHDEINSQNQNIESNFLTDSPATMVPSSFSTPVLIQTNNDDDNVEAIPMQLPNDTSPSILTSLSTFQSFLESAVMKPQDISSAMEHNNDDIEILLEGESNSSSKMSKDNTYVSQQVLTYSDFENSATTKPQELQSNDSQAESIIEFSQFQNYVAERPQDLSPVVETQNERRISGGGNSDNFQHSNESVSAVEKLNRSPPSNTMNLVESQIPYITCSMYVTDLDEEETEQPHSIIITEVPLINDETNFVVEDVKPAKSNSNENESIKSLNKTFDSHAESMKENLTFNSHGESSLAENHNPEPKLNGPKDENNIETVEKSLKTESEDDINTSKVVQNGSLVDKNITCNGNSQNYATVNFISETFEELLESNVDDKDLPETNEEPKVAMEIETTQAKSDVSQDKPKLVNGVDKVAVTEDFLQNEKKFCTLDSYLPLLSDIRFTGPASEIMSTSFSQESPTEPASPECEQDNKQDVVADIVKDWDSDTESQSSNSSSGEFIWKDGDGHETAVVTNTNFEHQQKNEQSTQNTDSTAGTNTHAGGSGTGSGSGCSSGSGSGSGSEGDEVEFVPSSWDCRAEPSKSSLRNNSLRLNDHNTDSKKRVVFKRQKYHCVYEYPRELADVDTHSPAYLPDLSTYCAEWDSLSAAEAALGYGRLFAAPHDVLSTLAFPHDYDEDFFISSSARPFESLGMMSSTSQFFPGMHLKPQLGDDVTLHEVVDFPPPAPPSPLATPSLDFTTPDSGVEDITPGSTAAEEDFKAKKLVESESICWKAADSTSSSESVSPSSPAAAAASDALGGLRHTRGQLKLDLPPSPHIPSPRHNRVFNFVLDKPKRRHQELPETVTPLVMTDETPVVTSSLPIDANDVPAAPEPTFSTFGKCKTSDGDSEQKIMLTDEAEESPSSETKSESPVKVEVKSEGTVLDSGDEDSGIESSSKATLERKANVS